LAFASRLEWKQFKETYNKVYSSDAEERLRFGYFQENMRIAKELTIKNGGKAKFGVTQFSDLSKDEFARFYLMTNVNITEYKQHMKHVPKLNLGKHAVRQNSIDWTTKGATTPVKDQGQCGSCWAFSATETIESFTFLKTGTLPVLSPEQIVDCDTTCYGCGGGWPYLAYEYIQQAGGQDTEDSYEYTAGQTGTAGQCQFNPAYIAAKISGYTQITGGEAGLLQALQTVGPVSVCVDASSWQTYQSGVLTSCGSSVDHCVQLTGYQADQSYWIVRNSWASTWGNNGFIYIQYGNDLCDIADYATVVTI
jgi:hypothetical protein